MVESMDLLGYKEVVFSQEAIATEGLDKLFKVWKNGRDAFVISFNKTDSGDTRVVYYEEPHPVNYYKQRYEPDIMNGEANLGMLATYVKQIREWAEERGLDKSSSDKQLIKLQEELGELAEAHNKGYQDKVKDSLGDMFVVMTIYAMQNKINIEGCVELAYNTIAKRRGKMVDGVFVKEEDL